MTGPGGGSSVPVVGPLEPAPATQTSVNGAPARLSASIDCADYLRIGDALDALEDTCIDAIHVDVMDGRFVPNFGVGMSLLSVLAGQRLPLDVHLMVQEPSWMFPRLAALGVRDATVHVETTARPFHLLEDMRRAGLSPGLAFNPATTLAGLADLMPLADRILVMGVDPGFPGQPRSEEHTSGLQISLIIFSLPTNISSATSPRRLGV